MFERQCETRAIVNIGTASSPVKVCTFKNLIDDKEHVAIMYPWPAGVIPIVRVHSECLTGDLLGSRRCDCGPQFQEAQHLCRSQGGVILYLRQEGRGIGLLAKLDAYVLQDQGKDTFEANRCLGFPDDDRKFDVAVGMLHALGLNCIRLLTNNIAKADALRGGGIIIREVLPTGVYVNDENRKYLTAKRDHGHNLKL